MLLEFLTFEDLHFSMLQKFLFLEAVSFSRLRSVELKLHGFEIKGAQGSSVVAKGE